MKALILFSEELKCYFPFPVFNLIFKGLSRLHQSLANPSIAVALDTDLAYNLNQIVL